MKKNTKAEANVDALLIIEDVKHSFNFEEIFKILTSKHEKKGL